MTRAEIHRNVFVWTGTLLLFGVLMIDCAEWNWGWWIARPHVVTALSVMLGVVIYWWARWYKGKHP